MHKFSKVSAESQWPKYVLWYLDEWPQWPRLTETVESKKSQLIYLAQYIKICWKQNVKLFNVEYPPDLPWTLPPGVSTRAPPPPPIPYGLQPFCVNVKELQLCLFNAALWRHMECGDISRRILIPGVVSACCRCYFKPREGGPGAYWGRGRVGPTTGLDPFRKRAIS